ncbi:MAG: membrane dipeptidase [Chitinophagaceae bacterium]
MFIVDAHLDLAMNAMEWNRDLRLPVSEIRQTETGMTDFPDRGRGTVSLPELRTANIGLVVATQIARVQLPETILPANKSSQQAWARTQGQLAWYKEMEMDGQMRMVRDLESLSQHLEDWNTDSEKAPVGYILSLEGADSLPSIEYLETAHQYGLRAIGPAHYGPGRYANGTDYSGHLSIQGRALLKRMQSLHMILDTAHLCDEAFWDAIDIYDGPIWSSHSNCRALVNHNRQISDDMIRALVSKNAVIGVALDAWMMVPDWVRGKSDPRQMNCSLETIIDHLDHICQLAGNAKHVGIGSDLDGAFGTEQSPYDLDTIAGLANFDRLLKKRGYGNEDISHILSGNWLSFLKRAWS